MQNTANEVIETIKTLPVWEKNKVFDWVEVEKQHSRQVGNHIINGGKDQLSEYEQAKKWIEENHSQYLNQWVCIERGELIASGADGREVYQKAISLGIKAPLIHFVEEEPEAYWGGWL